MKNGTFTALVVIITTSIIALIALFIALSSADEIRISDTTISNLQMVIKTNPQLIPNELYPPNDIQTLCHQYQLGVIKDSLMCECFTITMGSDKQTRTAIILECVKCPKLPSEARNINK